MRYLLLGIVAFLIMLVLVIMYFYSNNEEAAHSILLKILTPMFVGIVWAAATIEDYDRLYQDVFAGVIVLNNKNVPFHFIKIGIEKENYLQKRLPISFSSNGNDDEVINILLGGVLQIVSDVTGNCWNGAKTKVFAFNGMSSSSSCSSKEIVKINIEEKMFKIRVRPVDFSSLEDIGLPKKTKFTIKDSSIIIDTPNLNLILSISLTGMGTISSLGSQPKTDSYELITYAKKTYQGDSFSDFDFKLTVKRKIKWDKQWSIETKKQVEWSDSIIDSIKDDVQWTGYDEKFLDELIDRNEKNIDYSAYRGHSDIYDYKIVSEEVNIPLINSILTDMLKAPYKRDENIFLVNLNYIKMNTFKYILKYKDVKVESNGREIIVGKK